MNTNFRGSISAKQLIWCFGLVIGSILFFCANISNNKAAMASEQTSSTNLSAQLVPSAQAMETETGWWDQCKWTFEYDPNDPQSDANTLTVEPSERGNILGNDIQRPDNDNVGSGLPVSTDSISKVVIKPGVMAPEDSMMLFASIKGCKEISGLGNLNTSYTTSMRRMFFFNNDLTSIDVSDLKTDNVTDMNAMFSGCAKLSEIKGLNHFNTGKVTDMNQLFYGDSALTSVDLSGWDTSKVQDTAFMFLSDPLLKEIKGVESLNTSSLTNMRAMFFGCSSLTNLNLSKWNTAKVTDFSDSFGGMSNLEKLDISSFSNPAATDPDALSKMFYEDYKLWRLSLGANFKLAASVELPAVPGNDTPISGTNLINSDPFWVALAGGTDNNPRGERNFYSSDKLVTARPAESETYVWQQQAIGDLTSIKVQPEIDLFVGDQWNPESGFISATDYWGDPVAFKAITVSGDRVDTSQPGTFNVIYTNSAKSGTTKVVVKNRVTPPTPNPTPQPEPTPTPGPTPQPAPHPVITVEQTGTIAKKGEAVYVLKKIYLYKNKDFNHQQRLASYTKKPRINRPMFVVTNYAKSKNGHLRYVVRDVNHHSKTDGMKGYITASWHYVRPVYYHNSHQTLTVINPRGVNAYRNQNLTGKVKNYKQGTQLKVKGFVKHNLTTRYVLSNGDYITGNRKLVIAGNQKQPKQIKTKRTIYRYYNANFGKQIGKIKKGTILKVKKWEYSHQFSLQTFGAKRYQVAGGYVTANEKYVKVIK